MLAKVYNFFCQKVYAFLELFGSLKELLVGLGGCHEHFDQCLFVKVRKFFFFKQKCHSFIPSFRFLRDSIAEKIGSA